MKTICKNEHTPVSNENELTALILTNEFELKSSITMTDSMPFDEMIRMVIDEYIGVSNLIDNIVCRDYESEDIFPEELTSIYYEEYFKIAAATSEDVIRELTSDLRFVKSIIKQIKNEIDNYISENNIDSYCLEDIIQNTFGFHTIPVMSDIINDYVEKLGTVNFRKALEKNPEYAIVPDEYKELKELEKQESEIKNNIDEIISLLQLVDDCDYISIKEFIKGKL